MGPAAQDGYAAAAELHELFMAERWERLRPHVRAALSHLPADATILEVGAGSGVGTRVIAGESRARITAIEPSLVMRTALLLGVAADPDLAGRVTVLEEAAPQAVEDEGSPIDGFVCAHMLGHLDEQARRRTFAALRARMTPRAVGLLTIPPDPGGEPVAQPDRRERRRIGRREYAVRYEEQPDGDHAAVYEIAEEGRVVRTATFPSTWTHVPVASLLVELHEAGLTCEQVAPGVGTVRPRER